MVSDRYNSGKEKDIEGVVVAGKCSSSQAGREHPSIKDSQLWTPLEHIASKKQYTMANSESALQ
jgi:hypothetical protein